MNRLAATCVVLAGLNGFLAVAAGAYGRHAVGGEYPREMFAIASHYQIVHALALVAVAWLAVELEARWVSVTGLAAVAFFLGTVLFSGTLYLLGLSGDVPMAGAAPVGGFLLMAGWLSLAWTGARLFAKAR